MFHEKQWQLLKKSAALGKLSHAYLLVGPRGLGQESLAENLALLTNCQGEEKPCGRCPSCQEFKKNCHPDFLWREVTGNEDSQIDLIRELTAWLNLKPLLGKFKVAVVNRVENFSWPAQSALLKTLEEPPGQSLLVLITETGQVLPTIVSRTQVIRLFPLPQTGDSPDQDKSVLVDFLKSLTKDPVALFQKAKTLGEDRVASQLAVEKMANFLRIAFLSRLGIKKSPSELNDLLDQRTREFKTRQLKDFLAFSQQANYLLTRTNANPRLVLENLILKLF